VCRQRLHGRFRTEDHRWTLLYPACQLEATHEALLHLAAAIIPFRRTGIIYGYILKIRVALSAPAATGIRISLRRKNQIATGHGWSVPGSLPVVTGRAGSVIQSLQDPA
jgi:hypothetical protein